ncbi:type I secretion target repeat protein [Pseudooceanicola batsensis HTCC2597]|uniref:Type I secretion target repeat protein n=1 Tax=Pseudooceanicola batsensis (strain ATCC BAA-863 / DSM 15984 / KCTC 12145 / HTCC2597) TaxID=252305 RepID=A3TXD3_PSEBH|nr:calcium-binding protein [Pseudooceanicola batsensis]EAQ03493.1 type I secretion target repeat protein [Pseudooceanicola batsensis HTCC2597]
MLLFLLFPALLGLIAIGFDDTPPDSGSEDPDQPGGSGDDLLTEPDRHGATPGDDAIGGTSGADEIDALSGDDTIAGLRGADRVDGGAGRDALDGGSGDDLLSGGGEADRLFGGVGDDTMDGGSGDDLFDDIAGADSFSGGTGHDVIFAIEPEQGAPDEIEGGSGDDRFWGDDGDTMTGGDGADRFMVATGRPGAEPVVIRDLDFSRPEHGGQPDQVIFTDAEGAIYPRSAFYDGTLNAGIGDLPDGSGAVVVFGSQEVAIIEGHTAEELFHQTIWIGNLQVHEPNLIQPGDARNGTAEDDHLVGGSGDDTLGGNGGEDWLNGRDGDDLIDGRDPAGTAGGDVLLGGAGWDTIRADDGDFVAGFEGRDSYELVYGRADAAAITIFGYEVLSEGGLPEPVTLIDETGAPLSAAETRAGLTLEAQAEGDGTDLLFDGQRIAHLSGVAPAELAEMSAWLTNLAGPVPPPAPPPEDGAEEGDDVDPGDTGIVTPGLDKSATLISATATGAVATTGHFGGNAVFTVNTTDGQPTGNFTSATDALGIEHLRFPAGQGDPQAGLEDGEDWLDVTLMVPDDSGQPDLRPELKRMLDWAGDNDAQVTLVVTTRLMSVDDYADVVADRLTPFAEKVMRDYGEVVEAFEIGNEYWATMNETTYGQKADLAAIGLRNGMLAAGLSEAQQADILVQMATPTGASDFVGSKDSRGYIARLEDANAAIIDELGTETRAAIDGVVEHYYYNKTELAYTDADSEQNYIDRDYAVWDAAFSGDLDLHITEWNVRTTDYDEVGIRSASTIQEQFENMLEDGVDRAHVWPVQHNTDSDLVGSPRETAVLDEAGRVTNSVRGAMFDLMSESLPGLELMATEFEGDDGSFEINAYRSDDRTVVYVSSRSLEVLDLDVDLTGLVGTGATGTGVQIGIDQSAQSSDGFHWRHDTGHTPSSSVEIDGRAYYYDEHDVRASLTDHAFDGPEVALRLKPFEVIEITFTAAADPGVGPDDPAVSGEVINGTGNVDDLSGTPGDDTIGGFGRDDTLHGGDGDDLINGHGGDDSLVGGRGNDDMRGSPGNDTLRGWGGDDTLRGFNDDDLLTGQHGDDVLVGNRGNDLLLGNEGNDSLNGGIGHDTLIGGEGADTVTGWAWGDVFGFDEGDIAPGDTITDFTPGQDVIQLALPGISGLSDMTFQPRPGGLEIGLGRHGTLFLEGDLTVAAIAQSGNFDFAP